MKQGVLNAATRFELSVRPVRVIEKPNASVVRSARNAFRSETGRPAEYRHPIDPWAGAH